VNLDSFTNLNWKLFFPHISQKVDGK